MSALPLRASTDQPQGLNGEGQGWRTIETAPRDGSWFVICRLGEDDFYEVGRYEPLIHDIFEEVGDNLFRRVPKQVYDWSGFNNFHRATHWMPIPDAPA